MKNKLFPFLFALPITAGLCGASLRATQIKHSAEMLPTTPLLYGIIAVCTVALLMALIAAFLLKNGIAFSSPVFSKALPITSFIGATVILVYAALLLISLKTSFSATTLILALLSLYSAVSFIVLGKYRLAERDSSAYCVFSAVPSFWMCFLLVITFRDKISDPIISNYIFLVLSYISVLFFAYSVAAHILGKARKHVAVFSCFAGIFFILTEILSIIFAEKLGTLSTSEITALLPPLAFLFFMPCYTAEIIRKKD